PSDGTPVNAPGGCLCGEIRYRITAAPIVTSLCHCRSCRLATGAPLAAWVILPADGLVFDRGTPVRFASSPGKTRTFCGRCGTALTYVRDDRPDTIDIHTATLDAPDAYPPVREIWLDEKIEWMASNPRFEQFPRTSRG
ncbi:MAG: GFA family protein, partial [Kofleriaceae bacterium]